jgi:signal transduction histidine kinase
MDDAVSLLLIEDNPGDARLLREVLKDAETANFKLIHAARLAEGLGRLGEGGIDIVLLDLSLPDAQGLDTFLRIQAQAPEVPVVVLSGVEDQTLAVRAVQSGAQDYLLKGRVEGNLLSRSLRYAIERKRAEQRLQRHLRRITVLREINMAITSTLDLTNVLALLLERIDLLLHYPATAVWLRNRQSGRPEPVACRNLPEDEWTSAKWREGGGLAQVVWESPEPVVLNNVTADPRVTDVAFFDRQGFSACAVVPLVAKGEALGALCFYGAGLRQFEAEEVEFLATLGNQVSIAIHNSQLYEQTKIQASALERANQMKSEFLSVMSHELRTPLNVVLGYTEMIRNGILGEINGEQQDALGRVLRHSQQLVTMIDSILETARIESSRIRLEYRDTPVNAFLDDLRDTYRIPSGKNLTLTWVYPAAPAVMKTDPDKLSQILQNLINNAIKFTPEGEIRVSARLGSSRHQEATAVRAPGAKAQEDRAFIAAEATPANGDWIEFEVADTGIGIPEGSVPTVFQMFEQVDSSKTRAYGGAGLGLYIAKTFSELLGGELSVKSRVGKGSTFTVRLALDPRREYAAGV